MKKLCSLLICITLLCSCGSESSNKDGATDGEKASGTTTVEVSDDMDKAKDKTSESKWDDEETEGTTSEEKWDGDENDKGETSDSKWDK